VIQCEIGPHCLNSIVSSLSSRPRLETQLDTLVWRCSFWHSGWEFTGMVLGPGPWLGATHRCRNTSRLLFDSFRQDGFITRRSLRIFLLYCILIYNYSLFLLTRRIAVMKTRGANPMDTIALTRTLTHIFKLHLLITFFIHIYNLYMTYLLYNF